MPLFSANQYGKLDWFLQVFWHWKRSESLVYQSMSPSLQPSLVLRLRREYCLQQKLVYKLLSCCPSTPACACQQLISSTSHDGQDQSDSDDILSTSVRYDFIMRYLASPDLSLIQRTSCLFHGVFRTIPHMYTGTRQRSQCLWTFFHLYRYNNIAIFRNTWSRFLMVDELTGYCYFVERRKDNGWIVDRLSLQLIYRWSQDVSWEESNSPIGNSTEGQFPWRPNSFCISRFVVIWCEHHYY